MARKRKRVPQVLWRLFGDRARTLADTIVALIPPPLDTEGGCRCKERRCLFCRGDQAMSFLVRPGDSLDYRKLLTGCYAVVSENAPPVTFFDPHRRWSQREMVRRSIEIMLHEQPSSSNLICCGYDKVNRSSAVVDELTSSKWSVLLKRVGDALMMYLLKYTSLFLPLPRKKHQQIAGFPISDLCFKFSKQMPGSKPQDHSLAHNGSMNKRKRVEGVESTPRKQLCTYPSGSSCVSSDELSHKKLERGSEQNTLLSKKRTREYRWQRLRKRRQLVAQGTSSLILCGGNSCISDNLSLSTHSGLEHIHFGPNQHYNYESESLQNITRCTCCSIFQNEPTTNRNAEINRRSILYRLENTTSMLPRKHIFYTLKPNGSGASVLFNDIFEAFGVDKKNTGTTPCSHSKNSCPSKSTCLYHSLFKLLKRLIRESQNCQYLRLLERHCSIRSSYQDAGAGSGSQVEPSCPKKQVVSFVWAICRRIVPSPLLGEHSNWRVLTRNISKFIQLRKFEKFSLKECIYKMKISKFPLFSNKLTGCCEMGVTDTARHAILDCWMFWFFAHLVSPLVQANFYVTESEHAKQEVLYYRKSTWEKLMREAECMKDGRYQVLSHASTRKILGNRSFGFSRARLCPKKFGFRVLSNLQAPSRMPVKPPRVHSNWKLRKKFCNHRVKYRSFKSVNSVLQDLHVVLKGLWTKEPEKMGSTVFDYNDVYRKLLPFLFLLKNGSTNMPNVFIVVSDVSKAFDSVNQGKLLSVIKDAMLDVEYTMEKYSQVICTKKSLKVHHHLTLAHEDIVTAPARIRSRLLAQSLHSVVVKKALSRKIRKEEINEILEQHITRNVVQLGNNFYLQRVGIPQGSVLSSLLCSFYYGHMERNVIFPFLEKANGDLLEKSGPPGASFSGGNYKKEITARGCEYLLLRFIDDFLFISSSKKHASMFFSRLQRGVRDYNCCMNEEKYGVNFIMNDGQECYSSRLHVGKDGISFLRWSGLLVNCSTLEIQADYTRYLNSHLSSTLTVSRQGKVGRQLKAKLCGFLRPKCHPIFYVFNINSPGVVRLNIYQVFLLCAMKFTCYIANLSILPRLSPKFCFNAIDTSLRYMNRLIKRKIYSFEVDTAFRPKYDVKKKDIIWLGLYAYSRVLKKKQSRYKELLRLLRRKLKAYGKRENMSSELKYATDDVHSSVLWSIKY